MEHIVPKFDKILKKQIKAITGIKPQNRTHFQKHTLYLYEYIDALRTGGTELQQHTINLIESYKKEVMQTKQKNLELENKVKELYEHLQGITRILDDEKIKRIYNEDL